MNKDDIYYYCRLCGDELINPILKEIEVFEATHKNHDWIKCKI